MKLKLLITSCAFVFLYVGNVDAGIKKLKARVSGGDDRQQVQVQPLPPQPAPLEADHHPRGEALPHDVEGGDLPPPQDGGIPQAPPLGGGDEEHLALPLVQPQPLAELLRDNIMVNHYLHPEAPAEDAGEVHNEDLGGDEEEEQGEEQEEGAGNAELHPHDPLHVPADEPPAEAAPVQAQPQQDNPLLAGPAVAPPPAGNQQQPGQPGAGGDVPPPLVDNVPNPLQGEGAPGVHQPAPHPEAAPVPGEQNAELDGEGGDVPPPPPLAEDAENAGREEVVDDANPDAQPDVHAPRQPRRGGVEGGEDEQEMDIGPLW